MAHQIGNARGGASLAVPPGLLSHSESGLALMVKSDPWPQRVLFSPPIVRGYGGLPPCLPIDLELELALNRLMERAADDLSLLFPGEADEVDGVARDADGQRGVELGVVVGIHQGLAV